MPGQLILANTTVERVNEGLVFKQAPLLTVPSSFTTVEHQDHFEHSESDNGDENYDPDVLNDTKQKLLSQKGLFG